MAGPLYWNKTDGWFPVQSGSPVLIDQAAFEECCCVTFSQTWSFTDSGFIEPGEHAFVKNQLTVGNDMSYRCSRKPAKQMLRQTLQRERCRRIVVEHQ